MAKLERGPERKELEELIGTDRMRLWDRLCELIESEYEMEKLWNTGGKAWDYEYKYRRGGKTLCSLCAVKDKLGFMVIFGRQEQEKFEAARTGFSGEICGIYDAAVAYHDGKWLMAVLEDDSLLTDIPALLHIKRKPDRKG